MHRLVLALSLVLVAVGTLAAGCDDDTTPIPPPPDMTAPRPDCGIVCSPRDLSGITTD